MVQDIRTISMDKSKYSWDDVDIKVKKQSMDRSEYIQKLIEKDLEKKYKRPKITEIIMLLFLALITMLILVVK